VANGGRETGRRPWGHVLINSLRINEQGMGTGSMQDIYWETADFNRAYATAPKLCNAQLNCYFMWHHHNKRITKQAKGILPVHLRIYISRSTHVTEFPEQSYGKLRTSNSAKGKGCRRRILIGPGSSCH